jgi:exonuclease SbcD
MVIFSDFHVHNFQDFSDNRLAILQDVLEQVLNEARVRKVPALFCGDITHKHGYVPTIVLNTLIDSFQRYSDVKVYAISGNHDQISKSYLDNPVESIISVLSKVLPNLVCIDFSVNQIEGYNVFGIPYLQRSEDFNTYLKNIQPYITGKNNILLAHQTPTRLFNPFIPAQIDIDSELLDLFDFVFLGHIHKFQDFGKNRYMVGNPLVQDESDLGDKKGCLILDNGKVERLMISTVLDDIVMKSAEHKKAITVKERAQSNIDIRFYSDSLIDKYKAFCDVNKFTQQRIDVGLNFIK